MLTALAILVGAGAIAWAVRSRPDAAAADQLDALRSRELTILAAFTPAIAAAAADPRAVAVWQPVARTARSLFPEEFAAIDRTHGATFPFSPDAIRQAHARWTTEWLAWERSHDVEYKRRAAVAQADAASGAAGRAALDAIENEKLELYQRRYTEYVQVARTLQSLAES